MFKKMIYPFKRVLYLIYRFVLYRIIFPHVYKKYAKKPINKNKIIFIEMHQGALSDNFKLLYKRLASDKKLTLGCHFINNKNCGRLEQLKRSIKCLKDMADAGYIFINTACDVVDNVPMRSETAVTQLWHACGAFKRFGFSTADSIFGESAAQLKKYPLHRHYSHVTVSSPSIVWAYEEAMNISHESGVVKPVGVSRTDVFFDEEFINSAKEKLTELVPDINGRKIILYAPTFRGHINSAYAPDKLDIAAMCDRLSDKYILLIKNHPFIEKQTSIPPQCEGFCHDISKLMKIDELLCVADICISDYSSLVFEYSLFERPMLFFAYDIDEYNDWRGFYYDYDELTPGEVFYDTASMIEYICDIENRFNPQTVRDFKEKFMLNCDGHSTDRIIDLVFGEK